MKIATIASMGIGDRRSAFNRIRVSFHLAHYRQTWTGAIGRDSYGRRNPIPPSVIDDLEYSKRAGHVNALTRRLQENDNSGNLPLKGVSTSGRGCRRVTLH
jgi:hypothetical protein